MWLASCEAWPGVVGIGDTKEEAWADLKERRALAVRRAWVRPTL